MIALQYGLINIPHLQKLSLNVLSFSLSKGTGRRWASKYSLTTPIFYVNAEPHIGHLYTALLGDAAVRFQKLKNPGIRTNFMVGTDEHGTKVCQAAKEVDVQTFCDNISLKYRNLFELFSVEADDFVRTTQDRHCKAAAALWNKIYSKDLIYKEYYSGWYCVSDEVFVPELLLNPKVDDNGVRYTLEGNKPVQFMKELNYKFKLTNFQNDLHHWLQGDVIKPKLFKSQLFNWLDGLGDLSVSRPADRVSWGIPVPGDPSQTIYVWMDALSSYLCSNGYPDSSFKWPPDVQIIGKDILKFHGIFWPAFLMAADLEPPQCIFCHSHWMKDDEKMSKSKGNVIDPFQQSKKYTSDGFRYFLLREGVPHNDGNFTEIKIVNYLNSELADSLGNLLQRSTSLSINPSQIFPLLSESDHEKFCGGSAQDLMNNLRKLPEIIEEHFETLYFYKGIDAVLETLRLTNQFFHSQEPWVLRKDEKKMDHLNSVVHLTLESLRVCGILLRPIIPNITKKLLDKLSIPQNQRNFNDIRPYSWELTEKSKLSDLMADKVMIFSKLRELGFLIKERNG